jgi:uncharacterized protein (TIGR00251 family)
MGALKMRESAGGVIFGAKIVPGSSRTAISGLLDGMLKIRISAPAEKGKANRCLVEFLSMRLGVKKNAVSIISGQTNPIKQVEVSGISGEVLLRRLNLTDDGGGR